MEIYSMKEWEKWCPYCWGIVEEQAIKCKYCGFVLNNEKKDITNIDWINEYISYFPNWQIKEHWWLKQWKKRGEWIEYYENWLICYKWMYVDWKKEGKWVELYENFEEYEWTYVDWKKEGKWVELYENFIHKWMYINWEKEWKRIEYDEEGHTTYTWEYVNWKREWERIEDLVSDVYRKWYYKNWKIEWDWWDWIKYKEYNQEDDELFGEIADDENKYWDEVNEWQARENESMWDEQ